MGPLLMLPMLTWVEFLAMQWMIRAVGASTGAAISFAVNIDQIKVGGVSGAVYIVFIAIQCSSLLLSAFLIIDPRDVTLAFNSSTIDRLPKASP